MIPISELAWGQTDKVDDVLSQGQRVEVIVKKLDWDKNRISLSLKDTLENPWDQVETKYAPASVHTGVVSRLAQFGAFITLEPGIDGLLHISKLGSGRRINHPREVLEAGQEITVKIDSVDLEKNVSPWYRRITRPKRKRKRRQRMSTPHPKKVLPNHGHAG